MMEMSPDPHQTHHSFRPTAMDEFEVCNFDPPRCDQRKVKFYSGNFKGQNDAAPHQEDVNILEI